MQNYFNGLFSGAFKSFGGDHKVKFIVSHGGCLQPVSLSKLEKMCSFLCENMNFSYCSSVSSQMLF